MPPKPKLMSKQHKTVPQQSETMPDPEKMPELGLLIVGLESHKISQGCKIVILLKKRKIPLFDIRLVAL